jgi:hypothetical protein
MFFEVNGYTETTDRTTLESIQKIGGPYSLSCHQRRVSVWDIYRAMFVREDHWEKQPVHTFGEAETAFEIS